MTTLERCLGSGRSKRCSPDKRIVRKELDAATDDLERAKRTFIEEDAKWSSIQAYYSMFHSARALVVAAGYREKGHRCLIAAMRTLYVSEGILERSIVDDLELCMEVREEADYAMIEDLDSAGACIESAERLLDAAMRILS